MMNPHGAATLLFLSITSFIPSFGYAQSSFKIHNHSIDETVDIFLQEELDMVLRLNDCHGTKSGSDDVLISWGYTPPPFTKNLRQRAENEGDRQREVDRIRTKIGCDAVESAFDNRGQARIDKEMFNSQNEINRCTSFSTWFFDAGVLKRIEMELKAVEYSDLVKDMTAKVGSHPKEATTANQNGYGATWQNKTADWANQDLHVRLLENNNPENRYLDLKVESRADYEAVLAAEAVKPSPLDQ